MGSDRESQTVLISTGPPAGRSLTSLLIAVALTIPAIVIRFSDATLANAAEALAFGLAIVGAAFILSWAAEAAQLDISAGLAIALLAFIAVLPEYAVDMVLRVEGRERVRAVRRGVQGSRTTRGRARARRPSPT